MAAAYTVMAEWEADPAAANAALDVYQAAVFAMAAYNNNEQLVHRARREYLAKRWDGLLKRLGRRHR